MSWLHGPRQFFSPKQTKCKKNPKPKPIPDPPPKKTPKKAIQRRSQMPSLVLSYMVDKSVFGIAAAQLCPFKEHRGSFPPHQPELRVLPFLRADRSSCSLSWSPEWGEPVQLCTLSWKLPFLPFCSLGGSDCWQFCNTTLIWAVEAGPTLSSDVLRRTPVTSLVLKSYTPPSEVTFWFFPKAVIAHPL